MTRISLLSASLVALLALSACGDRQFRPLGFLNRGADPAPASVATPEDSVTEEEAVEEEAETEEAETVEEAAPAAPGELGRTVASLGDPTRAGYWLETGLVSAETQGRVVADNGVWVAVTLIPSGGEPGSGSRISLTAMQALGVSLTDLVNLTVIAGG